jgi:uncharacterized protein (TIGR00730 family)
MKRICVYCGSREGDRPAYREAAETLGRLIATSGIGIVYGGASVGLMGTVADAAIDAGGEVIGIIPEALLARELGHQRLTELRVVASMHVRKAMMEQLSDGFIALPGGLGTFEELFEILTWSQLGFHDKPIGVLNVDGYYDGLLDFLDHAVAAGFVPRAQRHVLLDADEPNRLLAAMQEYRAPHRSRWIREAHDL